MAVPTNAASPLALTHSPSLILFPLRVNRNRLTREMHRLCSRFISTWMVTFPFRRINPHLNAPLHAPAGSSLLHSPKHLQKPSDTQPQSHCFLTFLFQSLEFSGSSRVLLRQSTTEKGHHPPYASTFTKTSTKDENHKDLTKDTHTLDSVLFLWKTLFDWKKSAPSQIVQKMSGLILLLHEIYFPMMVYCASLTASLFLTMSPSGFCSFFDILLLFVTI